MAKTKKTVAGSGSKVVYKRVPISSLHEDPANTRKHGAKNLADIRASLIEFGQVEPLVIQSGTGKVIGGNGRLGVLRDLGYTHVDVAECKISDVKAAALGIALNRAGERAEWDKESLAKILKEIEDVGEELATAFDDLEKELEIGEAEIGERPAISIIGKETIVESAFRHFRATGFPYTKWPTWECLWEINKLASSDPEVLLRTTTGYSVADTYHPHRFHSHADGMRSPIDAFNEDKSLKKAIALAVEHNRRFEDAIRLVNGTQACANFRPGFALHLYRKYAPENASVLDTSTGYGGRLVGFMASGLSRYVGIDPNTETHEANQRMAKDLGFSSRVKLVNQPAEDVDASRLPACDFAFTSPPYFCKEHYSEEETQSWKRYKTGDAWRSGFLAKMLRLQFRVLKPKSYSVVNIADVKIKGKVYPLVEWTKEEAKSAGFTLEEVETFTMTRRFGAGNSEEVATEPVLIFRRP